MMPSQPPVSPLQSFGIGSKLAAAAPGIPMVQQVPRLPPDESAHAARAFSREQLAALLRITQALHLHRDCDALFASLADVVRDAVPIDALSALVPGWAGDEVRVFSAHDAEPRSDRIAEAEAALLASVAEGGETRALPALHRFVATPLRARGACRGALGFRARASGDFDAVALRLLDEIAATVAIAVDHCLGYADLERSRREQAALLAVNRAIGRHLHRDELFGALAGCLREIVPTERFGIELPIEGDRLQGHLLTPTHDFPTGAADGGALAEATQPTVLPAPGTACDWVLRERAWIVTASREELRARFPITFEIMEREGMESLCALPLVTGDRCRGVLFFMAAKTGAYARLHRDLLEQVASAVAAALDDCLAHEEVRVLRDKLAAENLYLQEEIRSEHNFVEIVGRSPALLEVLRAIEQVAATDATVLILGETGTGKELIARAIHDRSPRRERPLVKVNCGAIPAGLVESELFGHVKGAFTGAIQKRVGRFQLADGGTLFLDEVGELPLETQVKLLRVLQEREFEPVGGTQTVQVDVRVIAATNRDLRAAVREGRFRSDLFYRLNVFPLLVPPLRERTGDLPLLVAFFLERFARKLGKRGDAGVARTTLRRLEAYAWPGNVRELQNIIERAVVLSNGRTLVVDERVLPAAAPRAPEAPIATRRHGDGSLEDFERQHILGVLAQTEWRIEGPSGAATILELQPSTLRSRMRKLGIARPPG